MKIVTITPGSVPETATQELVRMRDGVRLATDVYLPEVSGPSPVVLVRLPYDKNGDYCYMDAFADYATRRGYVFVAQDVRGKFRSEGATEFGVHEVSDGYDTIDWIASQEWCSGEVVMIGDSYFGLTQLAAAISGHPALKAIAPRLTGTGLSTLPVHPEETRDAQDSVRRGYFATHYVENNTYEWAPNLTKQPLADTFEEFFAALGRRSPAYDQEVAVPGLQRGPLTADLIAAAPIPTLFSVGWYDNCAVWSWPDVEALLANDQWRDSTWLRVEAVDHENNHFTDLRPGAGDTKSRAETVAYVAGPALDFFDYHLGRTAAQPERVYVEVMHGEPATAATWPPTGAIARELYAVPTAGEPLGVLRTDPPRADAAPAQWEADGKDFVPSIAQDPFSMLQHPRKDLAPDSLRADVAAFDGGVLDSPVTLAGPIEVRGTITTDRVSTNLFARLLDVAPDGTASLIVRGNLEVTGADQAQSFRIRLLHTAYVLQPGHRLRLHLASSDFPEYLPNPGDGTDPWTAAATLSTRVEIAADAEQPLTLRITTL